MERSEFIRRCFGEFMKDVGTSIPGHVIAFDPDRQLAQLQIGVKGSDRGQQFKHDPIIECPVNFPGGSDFSLEYEIQPGAEGLIIFSQRCIDGWRESGGVAANPILRFHDVNDACFIPGIRSQVKRLKGFVNDGIRMRNADASQFVWLKSDGTLLLKASSVEVEGPLKVTGDTELTGNLTASGIVTGSDCKAQGVSLATHVHGGVAPGTSNTAVPTPAGP